MLKLILIFFAGSVVTFTGAVIITPNGAYNFAQKTGLGGIYYTISKFTGVNRNSEGLDLSLSGALELKEKALNAPEDIKNKVDEVREGLGKAEETFHDIKDGYKQTIEFVDETTKNIEDAKKTVEEINNAREKLGEYIDAGKDLKIKAEGYISNTGATSTGNTSSGNTN